MKSILTILFSFLFIVSGFSQTRNVVVDTNGVVVQPTNIWTANATNARSGLGLGSAATNPASAFQPSSSVLSNLASSNGVNLTNIPAAGVVGALATNGNGFGLTNLNATNISGIVSLANGGTGATNASDARINLELSSTNNVSFGRVQVGNSLVATNGFFGNVLIGGGQSISFVSGGSPATTRTNLDLGAIWLTNTNVTNFRSAIGLGSTNAVTFGSLTVDSVDQVVLNGTKLEFSGFGLLIEAEEQKFSEHGNDIFQWATNSVTFYVPVGFGSSAIVSETRTNLGLSATWLTNTNVTNFRTAIGLGATNDVTFANINVGEIRSTLIIANPPNSIATNLGIDVDDAVLKNAIYGADGVGLDWGGTNLTAGLPLSFLTNTHASITRTNLGLGAIWLTNTNATNFRSAIGLGWSALTNSNAGTGLVSVNTNGEVVSPTNFWQVAPINTRVQLSQPVVNATNAATNARNLYLYSLAISTTGVTNTITLPTNSLVFLGDVATVIHDGPTSSVTAIRQIGSATNLISLNQVREAVKFIYESDGWRLADNISYVEPIQFSGTNAAANAAASRTNLGLVLPALTNTNNATFQEAIFTTNTAPTNAGTFNDHVAWMGFSIVTNGVTNVFKIPLYK